MTDCRALYIHVPFCRGKCRYCDFYSLTPHGDVVKRYVSALIRRLEKTGMTFDTVYFGGGTPSLLGVENISEILKNVDILPGCEITLEANPSQIGSEEPDFDFDLLSKSGVNRVSIGLQSAVDSERKMLGRSAGKEQVTKAIERLRNAGIDNISLDVMTGIPGQTPETLKSTLDFCVQSGAKHISVYMLKIEKNTPFFKMQNQLNLPDEDTVCDMYLQTSGFLTGAGFEHYEISNFSLPGFESRHNLKYWHCEEYLGLGPAAHSFADGKRFHYERDVEAFIGGCEPVCDGVGGDAGEYVMLALRLKEGLEFTRFFEKFGFMPGDAFLKKAKEIEKYGFCVVSPDAVALTVKGFLISNTVIYELIQAL